VETREAAIRGQLFYAWPQSRNDLDTALRLTERYCVVLQTIRSSPATTVSYRTRAEYS
jgi:hypothetical protein